MPDIESYSSVPDRYKTLPYWRVQPSILVAFMSDQCQQVHEQISGELSNRIWNHLCD